MHFLVLVLVTQKLPCRVLKLLSCSLAPFGPTLPKVLQLEKEVFNLSDLSLSVAHVGQVVGTSPNLTFGGLSSLHADWNPDQ